MPQKSVSCVSSVDLYTSSAYCRFKPTFRCVRAGPREAPGTESRRRCVVRREKRGSEQGESSESTESSASAGAEAAGESVPAVGDADEVVEDSMVEPDDADAELDGSGVASGKSDPGSAQGEELAGQSGSDVEREAAGDDFEVSEDVAASGGVGRRVTRRSVRRESSSSSSREVTEETVTEDFPVQAYQAPLAPHP